MLSWPTRVLLELGGLSLAAFLWLSQTVSLVYWWQLALIWLSLAAAVMLMPKFRMPTAALLNTGALLVIGWLLMLRMDPQYGFEHWRGIMLGFLVFVLSLLIDWGSFRHKYIVGVSVLLLLGLTIAFGEEVGGARAWLRIGALRFQPVELARVGLLLFAAAYFDDHHLMCCSKRRLHFNSWSPLVLLLGIVSLFLVVQRDLGPMLLFFVTFISLVFYFSLNWRTAAAVLAAACSGGIFCWLGFSHVQQRIMIWLNPWAEPTGIGFQVVQGLFAVHNGGVFGTGLGFGLGAGIPAAHTDYAFALICEEMGLVGATAVLGFYLGLLFFGLQTAMNLTGRSQVLVLGIVLSWAYQVFMVAGGNLGLIPLSGITLPFVSYGSTSITANMCLLGIVTRLGMSGAAVGEGLPDAAKIKRVFGLVILLFALLWGGIIYWQLIRSDLADSPYNPRTMLVYKSERGSIYDRSGRLLASTDFESGSYVRKYHGHPSLSHVLGYFHPRYGMAGLEAAYNRQLANKQDLYLTIDAGLQSAIAQHMYSYQGAVVVTDPHTGKILALYSTPYVDPNNLEQYWDQYREDPGSPFYNRAVNGVYPPGSTLKPLILAAAYQAGLAGPETYWCDEGYVSFEGKSIQNFQAQAFGQITTEEALALSSNVVFAQLAALLKEDGLTYLEKFGLGDAPGKLPGAPLSEFGWAQLGIGQGEILVTPLQMAGAIGAIANFGMRMATYLAQSVGNWPARPFMQEKATSQVITQRTASQVRKGMIEVVLHGTGQSAQIPGVAVAGKTGTAENAHGEDHSWFVGFAPAEDPLVVVVVIVEQGGYGGGAAAQIGRQVIIEALDRLQ